ncbi:MAG: SDR family oxidoreductase [Thermoprotei archaeon]
MNDLKGRVAIVTGSGRGIGRSIAILLAKMGAKVVVNVKKGINEADETLENIRSAGGDGIIIQADVSADSGARKLIGETVKAFGTVDILINNAGVGIARALHDIDEKLWDKQINTNLKSAFLCSKYASEIMIKKGWGRIINISSIAGIIGMALLIPYSAAKAGLIGLTRALAAELSPYGITVNVVAAGLVKTKMGLSLIELLAGKDDVEKIADNWALQHTLTKKMLNPDEVAELVVFLASEKAKNITGQIFVIDSGQTINESRNYMFL